MFIMVFVLCCGNINAVKKLWSCELSNLVFSLNTTMPVFLMMVLGFFLHQVHIIDDGFASKLNKFVFSITLPVMLFHQLGSTNFVDAWDSRFVLFCFTVTAVTIALVWFLSFGIHSLPERGEFVQAAYRSSAAILGIAYMQNMYGDASMAPLMIIGSVPLYNIIAVVVLTLTAENELSNDRDRLFKKTVFSILKNPIILGIVFGLLWSLSGLRFPHILDKTLQDIGSVSTPLGLLAMGASVELNKVRGSMKNSLIAVFIKLLGCCMLFLPLAVWMGFRGSELIAILIMLGSPTTVSCYIMARNMGHEGVLTSNSVILATVFSSFSLTLWIWLLRSMGYL